MQLCAEWGGGGKAPPEPPPPPDGLPALFVRIITLVIIFETITVERFRK